MSTPSRPSGASLLMISNGNWWRSSYGAIFSPSSSRANCWATSRISSCSGVSSKSIASHLDGGPDVVVDEAHDVLRRGAGSEQLLDADRLQPGHVLGRNDAAAEDDHVVGALLLEQLEHALEEIVVGARQHAEPDGVGILLERGGHHLLRRLVEARVDDLDAGVAEGARDDLGTAIVAVEPRFGDDDANLALGHSLGHGRQAAPPESVLRSFSPTFMIWVRSPGTTFQSKPLPSFVQRGMRWRWKCGTDWNAAAPLAWSMLIPSGLTALRSALATRLAVTIAAFKSSSSDSKSVGAWFLVTTRQWPEFSGLMSMKHSVRASSYTFRDGICPSRILQNTQSVM